ncbi:thiaminase II [Paenibacillus mucilaginosus]|uniref:Aminopyrimidine aminohydrolase n=2 Tax=Paenibacillus mucilaginosus TaxID=61624 RepID=I0BQY0_9BACL|nr:thiaminase II [Paenibacillus mucilaginosus]AEI44684.1 Transcriptional activator tenA [Paenibacillus mucilaginosus KNP414]AFH64777.1 thiaminase [Paenibacillus mucilaginosus K02]MCG7215612.1 thiaminase II [Paenibacillus mucilaginosus]WDM26240.1 thiaminase II [Paenibacillus mucilaginosus]
MTFTQRLLGKLEGVWRQNHSHPFVREMGAGTLDRDKFRFYMIQDYLYLIDYAKLFALGAVKANDLATMEKFAALLHSTLHEEMALHRAYAARFGISEEELETAEPSPITLAYSHYMLHAAQNGSLAELVAALLPCMWSYWEIGKELSRIPGAADHEDYGEWIRMYSSEEFGALAQWCIGLLDELAEGRSEAELARLEEIFLNTTRYEYMFWDMAYHGQMWPAG